MIDIKKLTIILKAIPAIKLAYLIGSAASGHQRDDSDLDIVFIVDEAKINEINYGKLYQLIARELEGDNLDLRIVVPSQTDSLFLFQIISGQLLFSRGETQRIEFEKKTMLAYYDAQHIRNIYHYYLNKRIKEGSYGR